MKLTRPVQDSGVCPVCGERRLLERRGANHPLHLLLTIATAGVWAIGWIAFGFTAAHKPYRCQTCGLELMRVEDAGAISWEPLRLEG